MSWQPAQERGYRIQEYEACWSVRGGTCSDWKWIGGRQDTSGTHWPDLELPDAGGEFDLHLRARTSTGVGATAVTPFTYEP